jgi:hypothetical protein
MNTEETCPCGLCGKPTRMTGTKRCDGCWELEMRVNANPVLARRILADLSPAVAPVATSDAAAEVHTSDDGNVGVRWNPDHVPPADGTRLYLAGALTAGDYPPLPDPLILRTLHAERKPDGPYLVRGYSAEQMHAYVDADRKERQLAACNFCLAEAAKARAALPIDFKQATDQGGWPLIARALAEWNEDDGPVTWWAWCGHDWAGEPAFCGTPNDSDWPGYHTHWTAHPAAPTLQGIADGNAAGGKSGGAA